MELRAPNGATVNASGEHANRLLASGWQELKPPKPKKKKAKKTEG